MAPPLTALDRFYGAVDRAGARSPAACEPLRKAMKSIWKGVSSKDAYDRASSMLELVCRDPPKKGKGRGGGAHDGYQAPPAGSRYGYQTPPHGTGYPQPSPNYQQQAPVFQQPAQAYQQPPYQQPAPPYQQPAPAYQQPVPTYQQQASAPQPMGPQTGTPPQASYRPALDPCSHCGGLTHNVSRCYRLHPELKPGYGQQQQRM